MSDDRKYVRVYHDDLIRDYPAVYDDDMLLASWLRLLVVADAMWPTPPELPRSIKARPLASLVEIGLVVSLPGHRYRIRGLDAERSRRQDAARNAAASRWHSKGNAPGNAEVMPSRAEPSRIRAEQSRGCSGINPPPDRSRLAGCPRSGDACRLGEHDAQ